MSAEEEDQNPEVTAEAEKQDRKRIRKRKKKLMKDLREQMEFYFSDANLSKDRFLSQIIKDKKDGFIPLDLFKSFNKIKALTTDLEDIKKALKSSEILEVKDEQVRRLTPPAPRQNSDECTIYVEGLPSHADITWVRHLFLDFGAVEYVSIPRYRRNHKIKGFAFVEFDNPDSAKKALDYFIEVKPEEPSSQKEENKDKTDDDTKNPDESDSEMMPDAEEDGDQNDDSQKKAKKRRPSSEDLEQNTSAPKRPKFNQEEQDNEHLQEASGNEDMQDLDTSHKKKKKKRNKKKCVVEDDGEILKLRVISKAEWVRCRNKYLSLQKSVMSDVKKSLLLLPKDPPMDEATSAPSTLKFETGVILCLTLGQPVVSAPDIKNAIKQEGVVYVDVALGGNQVYVRCEDPESCQRIANNLTALGQPSILQGAEEEEYWKKIWKDQEEKRNKKVKIKRGAHWGRTKILNKVSKAQSKHTFFKD